MNETVKQSNPPEFVNTGNTSGMTVGSQVGPIVVKRVDVSPGADADKVAAPAQPAPRGETSQAGA